MKKKLRFFQAKGKKMRLHSMFRECEIKYCLQPEDQLILVTKEGRKHRYLVTVDRVLFKKLLAALQKQTS